MNEYKDPPATNSSKPDSNPANRDPITGTPGAHPIGTGLGAAPGAVAGAIAGTAVGGPVGAAVGAVVGAVAGGLAGKGAAEAVNPTKEDAYWRDNYTNEAYYEQGRRFDDYAPAYRTGYESRAEHVGRSFEQAEDDLKRRYERARGAYALSWDKARPATRAAWDRVALDRTV
jgi:phage tail tape-measure protein